MLCAVHACACVDRCEETSRGMGCRDGSGQLGKHSLWLLCLGPCMLGPHQALGTPTCHCGPWLQVLKDEGAGEAAAFCAFPSFLASFLPLHASALLSCLHNICGSCGCIDAPFFLPHPRRQRRQSRRRAFPTPPSSALACWSGGTWRAGRRGSMASWCPRSQSPRWVASRDGGLVLGGRCGRRICRAIWCPQYQSLRWVVLGGWGLAVWWGRIAKTACYNC